jgi:hypothetical protein
MSVYYYPSISSDTNTYGYDMLSQIYKNLIEAMTSSKSLSNNIRLKDTTNEEIKTKLEKLKQAESDLNDAIKNAELKKQLQIASNGIIDPNKIPDKYLPEILDKHSNLLGLTSTYNTRVKNLVDILQKINDVIKEKSGGQYGVRMSINYPTGIMPTGIMPTYPPTAAKPIYGLYTPNF